MKKTILVISLVLICILLAVPLRDQLIKTAVEIGASKVTGTAVKIDGFSLGIFKPAINIRGFKIYNPKGFVKGVLLDLPKVKVSYNLQAMLKGKMHLYRVEVELKDMVVVKNKEGKLNVDSLAVAQQDEGQGQSKPMPMQIDLLSLSIGQVVYKDFSRGEPPAVEAYNIGIDKTYKNITSAQQIVTLLLVESMKHTAIKGAKIYGVASLAGTAILPVGIGAMLISKDSNAADFNVSFDKAYDVCLQVLQQRSQKVSENKSKGFIKTKVGASEVIIKIAQKTDKAVSITVSARKYLIPQAQLAGGILYQISEELK